MKQKKITILALDPGGTTGCATFKAVEVGNEYLLTEYNSFSCGPEDHHLELWSHMTYLYGSCDELHLVTESFEYRNEARRGLNLMSREYIGIVRLFASANTDTIYSKQGPGMAKNFVTDRALRKMGVYKTGKDDRHEMDAYRHLFHYMIHKVKILDKPLLELGWK